LVFTEPLFFFDSSERFYIRYLDINHDNLNEVEIREKIRKAHPEGHRALSLEPCFHYEAIGEKKMAACLTSWFKKKKRPLDVSQSSRHCQEEALAECNAILLGNSRTNHYIAGLQSGLDFNLCDKEITLANPDKEKLEQSSYVDDDQYSYALVTRKPNIFEKRTATLLASNNGTASARVTEYLTSDEQLGRLFHWMDSAKDEPVLECFQVLFKVEMRGKDLAYDPEPVAWRRYGTTDGKSKVATKGGD
jgi:hypothetical protein